MRVLHICVGNLYGGVETLLVTLARCREVCPEMQPSFALCFEGRLSRELTAAGVPVERLGAVRSSRFWTVISARLKLRRFLKENRFDVVVTHMSWPHAVFGPEIRRAGLPLVNWVHGMPAGFSWLDKWASRTRPDLVIANSQYTSDEAIHLFEGATRKVLHCPVAGAKRETRDRAEVRRELGAAESAVVILQVSRMQPWKGHRLHIDALARLKDLPGWTCWIAGGAQRPEERAYLEKLKRQAEEAGIGGRVLFLGERSDVPSLMAAADIFCQPNLEPEPFGIVFIEALQTALPAVTAAMGGAAEIIDETCGMLFTPKDSNALSKCLRRLIESPGERGKMGRGGPSRASELCDPAKQMRRLRELLSFGSVAAIGDAPVTPALTR